ncbi:MAG TPA: hypothetical protein VH558_01755 [Pseudolabrys sp.]|jgi:hypothetical protein
MSSPVHDGSAGPNEIAYYAPRRPRAGLNNPTSIQPVSDSDAVADAGSAASADDGEVIVPFPHAGDYLSDLERESQRARRMKDLIAASGIAAVAVAGIVAVYGSLNGTGIDATTQPKPQPAPDVSLAVRLQSAAADLQKTSLQMVTPTLVVTEASGEMNMPIPLGLEVKNYTAGAMIVLSELPAGTLLSTGLAEGNTRWRIPVEELTGATVAPPRGFTGVMTIMAELRIGKDLPIVRSPVRLTWRAPPPPPPPPPAPSVSLTTSPPPAPEASPAKTQAADPPMRHLDARESASLLHRAEELKAAGDLAAARLLLQRVAETNNARAAFELAETYDPVAIKKSGGSSVTADNALAQYWYERAREWEPKTAPQESEAIASRSAASPK